MTRTLGTRKFQASHARNGDAFKEVYLALAAPGCGSVQVDEQPHAELMYAAVHEDAAPAKGRHFGRLDTELMLLVDFLEQTVDAYSIVTVPVVVPDAPPPGCYQILDKRHCNVLVFSFDSKRKGPGHGC